MCRPGGGAGCRLRGSRPQTAGVHQSTVKIQPPGYPRPPTCFIRGNLPACYPNLSSAHGVYPFLPWLTGHHVLDSGCMPHHRCASLPFQERVAVPRAAKQRYGGEVGPHDQPRAAHWPRGCSQKKMPRSRATFGNSRSMTSASDVPETEKRITCDAPGRNATPKGKERPTQREIQSMGALTGQTGAGNRRT